jgi:hypothetical protein
MDIKKDELLTYVKDLMNMRRVYYEPTWYTSVHAYENNHFVGWDSMTQSLIKHPTKKRFFIQFPECKKQVDGYENLLLSSNPVFQVYPTDFEDPKQQNDAKYQSLFLKQHYMNWEDENILHSLIHNSGVMPYSFIQIGIEERFNIETNSIEYTTVPIVLDAFDVLFDPRYEFSKQPALIKIIRTTSDNVAKSKLYKEYQGRNVTSFPQDYKEIYYIDKFGSSSVRYTNRLLLAECYIRDGADIKVITIDGSGNILRTRTMKNMPFWDIIMFQPSSGTSPMQPSIVESILPLNRSLDLVANRIESMTLKYVKGSYLMPANTTVTMSDEDGTILTYKGAVAPVVLPSPQLPEWAWQYISFMQSSGDRYGISAQVMGTPPKGSNLRSAKMMQMTAQSTIAQHKMYIDSFTYALKQSAQVMILLESRLMSKPKKVTLQNAQTQEYETKHFVGEDYYRAYQSDPNIIPLPKSFSKLSVEIEDESTHGIEAKRNTFERLAKLYPEVKMQAPELQKELLALFMKTGDIASVMEASSKSNTLLTSSMKNIVDNIRQQNIDDPQLKQALSVLFDRLSKDPSLEQPPNPNAIKTKQTPHNTPNTSGKQMENPQQANQPQQGQPQQGQPQQGQPQQESQVSQQAPPPQTKNTTK